MNVAEHADFDSDLSSTVKKSLIVQKLKIMGKNAP